jgi:hypothetical protein
VKRRSKQNSVIQHSLEETIEITKRRLIKDVVLMIIGIVLLIRGINDIDNLILFLLGIIGGIFAFAYLIAALSNWSKYMEYKDMNAIDYKKRQEQTQKDIKQEDEQTLQAYKNYNRMQSIRRLFGGW